MHGQHVGRNRSQGHRREVLERIVRDLRIEARIDDVARGHEHDGVAVGRGACGVAHADITASANLVLDVELLSEILGEFLHQQTRDEIAPIHCPMPPVLPTERIAHLGTVDCCTRPPGRYETIAVTPPIIFSKEVAQKQATPLTAPATSLSTRNRFTPNFRGWRLDKNLKPKSPPYRGATHKKLGDKGKMAVLAFSQARLRRDGCQSRPRATWPPCHSAERGQAQSRLFIRGRDLQRAFSPAAIVTLSNRIRPAFRRWGARSNGKARNGC